MGVFDLFRSKGFDPDTYERELTALNKEINSILIQKRRIDQQRKLVVFKVRFMASVLYLLIMYYNYFMAPPTMGKNFIQRFVRSQTKYQLLFYIVYPVVGYAVIRALIFFYTYLYKKKEKQLDTLRKKLKKKIDDLKKITNFETTNNLLTKFGTVVGDGTTSGANQVSTQAKNRKQGTKAAPMNAPVTNKGPLNAVNDPKNTLGKGPGNGLGNRLGDGPILPPTSPLGSLSGKLSARPVSDRLLDLLIGSDNNESVEDRYALICRNCFSHNGLAPPGSKDPFSVVYLCPKCGFINGDEKKVNHLKGMEKDDKEMEQEKVSLEEKVEEKGVLEEKADQQDEAGSKIESSMSFPEEVSKHLEKAASTASEKLS